MSTEEDGRTATEVPPGQDEPPSLSAVPTHLMCNEKTDALNQTLSPTDIEHVEVNNDPRLWSRFRKMCVLVTISAASMITGLGGSIYTPGIAQIESQLHATKGEISWSLSLFILIQGSMPVLWSSVSEIFGRKAVYLVSLSIALVGAIVAGTAHSIGVLIAMRCLQAIGTAAILSIGAATLADIYEPHERGTMMGIYYCAPLIGPAIGPIIGGALTQGFSWRAAFYFLAIIIGTIIFFFLFFKDTFRRERSLTYQLALRKARAQLEAARRSETSTLSHTATAVEKEEEGRGPQGKSLGGKDVESEAKKDGQRVTFQDVEAQTAQANSEDVHLKEIRLSITDVNPIKPMWAVLRRPNNIAVLLPSGVLYGITYSVTYTAAILLNDVYHLNALEIGLVLLAFGVGNMFGSIVGGRFSDYMLKRLKEKNGGQSEAEMRLDSIKWFLPFIPLSTIAYGWMGEKHVNVGWICVILFIFGFFLIAVYSSTLAYIVDANVGRSSSAVACNSLFRGTIAFVAAEVAVPIRNSIGEGGLYTIWAGITALSEIALVMVLWKGSVWRQKAIEKENRHRSGQ